VRKAVVGLIAAITLAPAAAVAQRTLPPGFWGANWNFEVTASAPQMQALNWARMAASGVESQRALFLWSAAQPSRGGPFDFSASDALVTLAVSHGIQLLPVVAFAPGWARKGGAANAPPSDLRAYASYLRALIGRYGPRGSFWALNRRVLPTRPIRAWQIWNEPSANYQWTIPAGADWAPGYGALLRASYRAVKDADPGASVVLAGLPNFSWRDLEHLYRVGRIHGSFDIAAVHPYSAVKHGVLKIVELFRAVMRKHGDGGKPLWVTEWGLPASKGQSPDPSPLQTTDGGMARFMRATYDDLTAGRRWQKLGVARVYWYTWASSYNGWIFQFTGLWQYIPGAVNGQDALGTKPSLAVYRELARRVEGCAKNSAGACVSAAQHP
jgi:hypothetical protein